MISRQHSFRPGMPWLDTEGKRIQAHGGSVFFEDGVYYWYGENKERTIGDGSVWHWGVRCYASTDLYNWTDLGLIIPPDVDGADSPLHPSSMADRPHIIHNRRTGAYVCWIKVMEPDGRQRSTILVAERLLGPYTIVRTGLRPLGMDAGDFDLAVAADGKAYYYFERVHSETICADLTDDYTDVTGYYSTHFPHSGPPFTREATAHFIRGGRHYLLTSGTTGYLPNPSQIAVSDTWHGPYRVLGDPHVDDTTHTSYHSQISSVFKVQGHDDLYIAVADRWAPGHMDLRYVDYATRFMRWSGQQTRADETIDGTPNDDGMRQLDRYSDLRLNTSQADYVWLPITFDHDDRPVIAWHNEWKIEDYD